MPELFGGRTRGDLPLGHTLLVFETADGGIEDAAADSIAIAGPATLSLNHVGNETKQLNAVIQNVGGDDLGGLQPDSWASDQPTKASVSATGVVTALLATVTPANITATYGALTSDPVAVTVT